MFRIAWKGVMSLPQQIVDGVIPDLREIPLNQLVQLGDSALAHSFALYRERLRDGGLQYNAFNNYLPSTITPRLGHASLDQYAPTPR
jgi:hypothetical protein